jgi:hypothetical protein
LHDRLGGEVGASAWPIFDDELLSELFGQPLADQSGTGVEWTTSRETDEQADRSCRIIERRHRPGEGGDRGASRCHLKELPARKIHSRSSNCLQWVQFSLLCV